MTVHVFAADARRDWNLRSVVSIIRRLLEDRSERHRRRRRYREIEAELLDYSRAQLAELGMREADIDVVARHGSRD